MIIIVTTIYIDVLLGTNIIINYFILLAVSKVTKVKTRVVKIILGSCFSALCSLVILAPDFPFLINLIVKLVISIAIILISFDYYSISQLIKNIALFYLISFGFCGVMLFFWFITPQQIVVNNSIVYFNISPVLMVITTILSYLIIRIINKITEKQNSILEICKVKVINNDKFCQFYAKVDTGNTLCEPFSNIPVIVVNEEAIKIVAEDEFNKLLNATNTEYIPKNHYRLIPFNSIGGNGLLPAFLPKEVYINDIYCPNKVYIAVCKNKIISGEIKAMINPEIIEFVKDDSNDFKKTL